MIYEYKKMFFHKRFILEGDTITIEQKARLDLDYKVEFNLSPFHLPHGESRTFVNEFSFPIVLVGVLVFGSAFGFANGFTDFDKCMMIVLMITGVIIMALSALFRKKMKNAIYYNEDNTYIFEVSQYDKTADEFDAFVAELDERIKKSKESTEN